MNKIYFKEEQKFNQWWIQAIVAVIVILWFWQLIQQVILGIPFGSDPSPDWAVIIIGVIPIGVVIMFQVLKLKTVVTDEGVSFRFLPFQRKPKVYPVTDIKNYEAVQYRPIRDYGGWGIRIAWVGSKGIAFNVSGNKGVRFELKSGKKVLIGTQRPDAFKAALDKLFEK